MSQENVEIVRQALEKWNRGDLDALVEVCDDDVVLRMAEGWPERVFFGKAAARSFFGGWAETVGQEIVIEEAIDAGPSWSCDSECTCLAFSRASREISDQPPS
jgi:ketosteroid isomerase-like protein